MKLVLLALTMIGMDVIGVQPVVVLDLPCQEIKTEDILEQILPKPGKIPTGTVLIKKSPTGLRVNFIKFNEGISDSTPLNPQAVSLSKLPEMGAHTFDTLEKAQANQNKGDTIELVLMGPLSDPTKLKKFYTLVYRDNRVNKNAGTDEILARKTAEKAEKFFQYVRQAMGDVDVVVGAKSVYAWARCDIEHAVRAVKTALSAVENDVVHSVEVQIYERFTSEGKKSHIDLVVAHQKELDSINPEKKKA